MTLLPKARLFLLCVLAVGLLPASVLLGAGTVQFPKDHPVFEVKVPAGWTTKWSAAGGNEGDNLEFDPGDGGEYGLIFSSVREARDMDDLKKRMPSFVQELAKSAGVQTVATGEIKTTINVQQGVTLAQVEARATGAAEAYGYTFTICGFTLLMTNQYFVIGVIASKEGTRAHQQDFEAIRDSIHRVQ